MIAEFRLPDLGEGLTESEIVSWHVAVGDAVELNQVIGEVETAKAVVELPSPFAGTVTRITHEPGTMVDVGEVIITFDLTGADAPHGSPGQGTAGSGGGTRVGGGTENGGTGHGGTENGGTESGEPAAKRIPTLVGYGADPETSARPVRRQRVATVPAALPATATAVHRERPSPQTDRPRSSPPVRKLARDLGIDLELLAGSGDRGVITRSDVVTFAGHPEPDRHAAGHPTPDHGVSGAATAVEGAPSTVHQAGAREVRTPIKGVRKFMAQAMVQSAFTAPHVSEFLTVDVTAGMDFLAKLRMQKEFAGIKVTPLTLAAKAVCLAAARRPALNSRWDEGAQEVVEFKYMNLGIAAATPRGLVVPNVKDAHALGLRGLAEALGNLAETARAGKTQPADLAGGTFSITNIGVFGIDAGTPILNPGEAGILALGAVRRTPWEHNGQVALRQVMTLSLSFDHRLVDGEQGSRFLADVGAIMADPAMALVLG